MEQGQEIQTKHKSLLRTTELKIKTALNLQISGILGSFG